jgi:hypothetical protein
MPGKAYESKCLITNKLYFTAAALVKKISKKSKIPV